MKKYDIIMKNSNLTFDEKDKLIQKLFKSYFIKNVFDETDILLTTIIHNRLLKNDESYYSFWKELENMDIYCLNYNFKKWYSFVKPYKHNSNLNYYYNKKHEKERDSTFNYIPEGKYIEYSYFDFDDLENYNLDKKQIEIIIKLFLEKKYNIIINEVLHKNINVCIPDWSKLLKLKNKIQLCSVCLVRVGIKKSSTILFNIL
jgi:hypothetical protein